MNCDLLSLRPMQRRCLKRETPQRRCKRAHAVGSCVVKVSHPSNISTHRSVGSMATAFPENRLNIFCTTRSKQYPHGDPSMDYLSSRECGLAVSGFCFKVNRAETVLIIRDTTISLKCGRCTCKMYSPSNLLWNDNG